MKILEEQWKRDSLNEVLRELSKSQDVLKERKDRANFFRRLESIYYRCEEDNFRHFYSDIFSTLTLIDGDSSIGSLDILAQNMQAVKDGYVVQNEDENGRLIDISKEIIKLYDHTNLDIARINYTKTMTNDTLSELSKNKRLSDLIDKKVQESEEKFENLSQEIVSEAQRMSKEMREKQESMQKEYVTILGIFAAIILAFTGGMVFSSSVLENIAKPSVFRISLISFIIGMVFFNLIWVLIDFIRDINEKPGKRKWVWWGVNLIFVGGILGVCFAHKYHWF